jgi:protease I
MARVGFIVDEMFEDSELGVPLECVKSAGHEAVVIGRERGKTLEGKKHELTVQAEKSIDDVSADSLDALVIPGGYSPDKLRVDARMVALVRDMFEAKKPIAAICHAGSMLVEADVAADRTLTSWPSIKTDLINAGAMWVDREVVQDENLITSRKPDDLPAFCRALLDQLSSPKTAKKRSDAVAASPR